MRLGTTKGWARTAALTAGILLAGYVAAGTPTLGDTADDAGYDDGWTDGDNGGTGFGAWTSDPTFTLRQTGAASSIGLDPVTDVNGESFLLQINPGPDDGSVFVQRNFAATPPFGSVFEGTLQFSGTGNASTGVWFLLQGSLGTMLSLRGSIAAGQPNWLVVPGNLDTGIPRSTPIHIEITYVDMTQRELTVTPLTGSASVFTSSGGWINATTPTGLAVQTTAPTGASAVHVAFNSLQVTPGNGVPVELDSFAVE